MSLLLEELKEIKTVAIHCSTLNLAESVAKLINNSWGSSWHRYGDVFCLSLNNNEYCDEEWYIRAGYTVVDGEKFLAANQICENFTPEIFN